jgi:hypothetical protein
VEEGYDYVCDWVLDDQPVWLKTRSRRILNVPYTQECNDVAMMLIQHHPAREYFERARDQFEQIYAMPADGRARDGAGAAPLHSRRAAPAEYFRAIIEMIRGKKTCCSGPEARSRIGISGTT